MSEPVFQPEFDGITDAEWQELMARASGDGQHFFSENQLYLAYARHKVVVTRYIARRGLIGLCVIPIGLATWVYALKADWGLTLVLGIALTLSGVGMVGTGVVTRRDPAAREPISRWLSKWTQARGAQAVVDEATLGGAELEEYLPARVDCLVIVQRDPLVDLLLKNGAHRPLSALIVSETGYPSALASEARRLLQVRADLKIIAVHDATREGVAMVARLQSGVFPLAQRSVLDAGLFPADVTWLAELAPAIPATHADRVPLDSLSFDALLIGLSGVAGGALSLYTAIEAARATELANGQGGAGSSTEADTATG